MPFVEQDDFNGTVVLALNLQKPKKVHQRIVRRTKSEKALRNRPVG